MFVCEWAAHKGQFLSARTKIARQVFALQIGHGMGNFGRTFAETTLYTKTSQVGRVKYSLRTVLLQLVLRL
jgi:hypothetical protein